MSSMDVSKSDVDFDSYWDEEARNPNRNRIRIGRQYQAQCPLLLKIGESDGRKLEDLETLIWNPHNPLSNHHLNQYFAIAKSIGLFIQAIDTCQDGIEETECLEEEKCSLRPFEILDSGTKCVLEAKPERPVNNASSNASTTNSSSNNNVIPSPEKQSVTTRQRLQQQKEVQQQQKIEAENDVATSSSSSLTSSSTISSISSTSPLKQSSNTKIQTIAKGLPAFILSHHNHSLSASQQQLSCKFTSNTLTAEQAINLGSTEKYNVKTLAKLLMGQWNDAEAKVFSQAIKECGKNFSAIKKDYLPWKSVRSIIEFYYLTLDKEKEQKKKQKHQQQRNNKAESNKTNNNVKQSALPENNSKKRNGQQQPPQSSDSTKQNQQNNNSDQTNKESSETYNDGDSIVGGNSDSNNKKTTDHSITFQSPNKDKSECLEQEELSLREELLSLAKGVLAKNGGNICVETNVALNKLTNNNTSGNILNGNNSTFLLSPEARHLIVPGQEVRPLKAKPILSQNDLMAENGSLDNNNNNNNNGNTNLGSLNLYLHGELVLRLNAQQQESGQKWVESMEVNQSLRRKHGTINNGFNSSSINSLSSRSAGMKRSFSEANKSSLFKEDPDDISSTGGGDGSGSDDDSMTSNESSSLVASSPSSSSTTITTSATASTVSNKKARVKMENLNGTTTSISSSPNSSANGRSNNKSGENSNLVNGSSSSSSNKSNSSTTINQPTPTLSPLNYLMDSPLALTELDIKKKLFEYYQLSGINNEEMQMLLAMMFHQQQHIDPPKAHSNNNSNLNTICSTQSTSVVNSHHQNNHNSNNNTTISVFNYSSPIKSEKNQSKFESATTPVAASLPSVIASNNCNGYTNGYNNNNGPVDLTRKSPLNHHSSADNHYQKNQSPSRHKSSNASSSSPFSIPRTAHESSSSPHRVSPSLSSHHRHLSMSSSVSSLAMAATLGNNSHHHHHHQQHHPFSLPAPPPPPAPNVPVSPNKLSTTSTLNRKIRGGGGGIASSSAGDSSTSIHQYAK